MKAHALGDGVIFWDSKHMRVVGYLRVLDPQQRLRYI
jgi:hypothetical protein